MVRHITLEELTETKGKKIKDLAKFKSSQKVEDLILEALDKELKIVVIGEHDTGKSTVLKTTLQYVKDIKSEQTCDYRDNNESIEFIAKDKCRYATADAKDTIEFINRIKDSTSRKVLNHMLIIQCVNDKTLGKTIKSIDEIVRYDDENTINNIIEVSKLKYYKINDITA